MISFLFVLHKNCIWVARMVHKAERERKVTVSFIVNSMIFIANIFLSVDFHSDLGNLHW